MSKKTAKNAAAPKATKATKKAAAPANEQPKDECPRGGSHEPDADGDCKKCLEPGVGKKKGKAAKAPKAKKAPKEKKEKKVSAIDAAAQVLASSKEPMNCKAMIDAMAAKGLWTSPGGKTPHATLYSAIIREINEKGKDARFVKTERGHFAGAGTGAAMAKPAPKASDKKKAAKTEIAEGSPGPKSLSKLFKI